MKRGASFRHLRQLSLPWWGSEGAAPGEAERELAEKKGEEPEAPRGTGEAPVAEEMEEDISEGEEPPLRMKR